jgi:diguanylate cyclase (GGDEF)-like protein
MPMASSVMAASVAERIRGAVESKSFTVRTARTVTVGMSLGVACFPVDGDTTEELLTAAARNMQRDKHSRKTITSITSTPAAVVIDALR